MKRPNRLRVAVALALVAALGCGGGGETPTVTPPPPPPPPPPALGSIAGSLQLVAESRGLGGVAVVLRRGAGDSLTSALTDAAGAFRFSSLTAGAYRVGVRLPAGHRADAASDTAQQVAVASGAETAVQLRARAITVVVDTVLAGVSDTVTLGNGARVVVTLPAGAAPLVVSVRAAAADSATWGRPTIGATVEVAVPATSGVQAGASRSLPAEAVAEGGTISFALPVTSPPVATKQAVVRGLFMVSGSPDAVAGLIASQTQSVLDPLTGAQRSMLVGQLPFSLGELSALRLAVVASTVACPEQFSIAQDTGFIGSEPLLLIHGIQLDLQDCDEYTNYHPSQSSFKDLISALKSDVRVRTRYSLHVFKYPTNHGVANAARGLALSRFLPELASRSGKKVTVIAHSMGGLVARKYLGGQGDLQIAHLITLATPHGGTKVANAGVNVLNANVESCYNTTRAGSPPGPLLWRWFLLRYLLLPFGLQQGTQGIDDLTTTSTILSTPEPYAAIVSTFAGESGINAVDHQSNPLSPKQSGVNSTLTASGCYLKTEGAIPNDAFVTDSSARPSWSKNRFGPFPRDHIQMSGADAQGVNDNFIATIIKLLLPSPIQVTSNAATTWTLVPGGLTGNGTNGTFSVMPAPSGSLYTLSAQTIAGRAMTISNSKGGGSAITLFPGDAASFTITYSGAPPNAGAPGAPSNLSGVAAAGLASLTWSDNSNNETGFKIERATGATGTFAEVATTGSGVAAYLDRNVTAGASYSYRVRAYNSAGDSPCSNALTVTIPGGANCPAPIVVSSDVGSATTWTAGQAGCTHYLVRGKLTVNGALSIGPGTVIDMASGAGLTVFGSLNAVGTLASRITVRGEQPVRGSWASIDVRSVRALNELSYVDVRHGGGSAVGTRANVSVSTNGELRVHNARFEESAAVGLWVERFGELPTFSNNTFHNNTGAGLRLPAEEAGALDPASSYATGNGVPYIDVEGATVSKTQTWRVTNTPLRLFGNAQVNGALAIAPGVQLWMAASASMTVFGSLNAVGTSASRITIRGEQPVRGSWASIDVRSVRALNELSHVDIRHGGGSAVGARANVVVSTNGALRVNNARFEESAAVGLWVERFGELPTFSNNTFHNNTGAGLRVPAEEAGALDPASSYATGNGVPYIDVEGVTVSKTQTWRVTNTPLRLFGNAQVNGALAIAPGVQMWMAASASMTVFGSINAVGTSASRINIRGERAVRGSWASIDVRSVHALNELSHVDIRHGGGSVVGARANVVVSTNGALRVNNARFEESAAVGLWVERFGELPTFSSNIFHNNTGAGLRLPSEEAGALDPASSYATGNGVPYIDVEGATVSKTQTWRVTNTPLRLFGNAQVNGTLAIAPGVQLWMASTASMTVFGSLNAVGTSASRITIRGEQAVRGFWETIDVRSASSLNELAYVDTRHGGGGSGSDPANVTASSNARLRVTFSSFSESGGWGVFASPFAIITPSPLASGGNTFGNNTKGASNIP